MAVDMLNSDIRRGCQLNPSVRTALASRISDIDISLLGEPLGSSWAAWVSSGRVMLAALIGAAVLRVAAGRRLLRQCPRGGTLSGPGRGCTPGALLDLPGVGAVLRGPIRAPVLACTPDPLASSLLSASRLAAKIVLGVAGEARRS